MPNFPMGLINSRAGAGFQDLALNHHNSMQTNGFTQYSQKTGDNLMVSCFIYLVIFFRSWMSCVLLQCCHEAMWEGGVSWGVGGQTARKGMRYKNVRRAGNKWRRAQWIHRGQPEIKVGKMVAGPDFLFQALGMMNWVLFFPPNSTRNLERKTQMLK